MYHIISKRGLCEPVGPQYSTVFVYRGARKQTHAFIIWELLLSVKICLIFNILTRADGGKPGTVWRGQAPLLAASLHIGSLTLCRLANKSLMLYFNQIPTDTSECCAQIIFRTWACYNTSKCSDWEVKIIIANMNS